MQTVCQRDSIIDYINEMNKTLKLSTQILIIMGASLGLSPNSEVSKDGIGFTSLS
jgi:hypothetical protein